MKNTHYFILALVGLSTQALGHHVQYNDDNTVSIFEPNLSFEGKEYRVAVKSDPNAVCSALGFGAAVRSPTPQSSKDLFVTLQINSVCNREPYRPEMDLVSAEWAIEEIFCTQLNPVWPKPHQLSML